jgi:hypothetical protein
MGVKSKSMGLRRKRRRKYGPENKEKKRKSHGLLTFWIKPIHQDSIAKAQSTWAFTVAGQSPI